MFLVCTVQHMDSKLGLYCVQFFNPLHSMSIALYSRFQYQYEYYNSCGKKFTLQHAMNCKFGGIIHRRHDKIKHELMNITAMATRESAVGAPVKNRSPHKTHIGPSYYYNDHDDNFPPPPPPVPVAACSKSFMDLL